MHGDSGRGIPDPKEAGSGWDDELADTLESYEVIELTRLEAASLLAQQGSLPTRWWGSSSRTRMH